MDTMATYRTLAVALILSVTIAVTASSTVAPYNNCIPLKAPTNGLIQCAHTGVQLLCTAVCSPGYKFSDGSRAIKRTCTESATSQTWDSQIIPFCIPANTSSQCPRLLNTANVQQDCYIQGDLLICSLTCGIGFFEDGKVVDTRTCNTKTKIWNKGYILPKCTHVEGGCMVPLLLNASTSQFSASSVWDGLKDYIFSPDRARLESVAQANGSRVLSGGWRPATNSLDQFIQVDLQNVMRIIGVTIKGRNVIGGDTALDYVTRFRVLYSKDTISWEPYSSQTVNDQFLDGNVDTDTPLTHIFACPLDARYVRINPLAWNENIGLRFELLGCLSDGSATQCSGTAPVVTMTPTVAPQRTPETPTAAVQTTAKPVVPVQKCFPIPPPKNGMVHCERRHPDSLLCIANCQDGYVFETSTLLVTRECDQHTGIWPDGQGFPACIRSGVVTPPVPSHNYTYGCLLTQDDCKQSGNGDFQTCGGCHFFATCSEGFLYVRACPEHLLFDTLSQQCEFRSRTCKASSLVG